MSAIPEAFDVGRVSPELALVDPELARAIRGALPDPPDTLAALGMRFVSTPMYVPPVHLHLGMWIRRAADHAARAAKGAAVVVLAAALLGAGGLGGSAHEATLSSAPALGLDPAPAARTTTASATESARRRFSWAPVVDATGYHVEFFRGDEMVFAAATTRPEVTVPRVWILEGRRMSFEPGEYRWYVWPVRNGLRVTPAVVNARLSVAGS